MPPHSSNPALPAASDMPANIGPFRAGRLIVVLAIAVLACFPGPLGETTRSQLIDAFTQVSVFVAATLMLFYGAERFFKFNIGALMESSKMWQVPIAAFLGMTPGCGGAVVVVAAYSSGHVGMGAMVATLTATMGDAAFLLIATRPETAAVVLPMSFVVGVLSGWLVDRFNPIRIEQAAASCAIAPRIGRIKPLHWVYLALAVPGLVVGAAQIAQVSLDSVLGVPVSWIALAGIAAGLAIWATSPVQAMTHPDDAPPARAAEETSFISIWVIGAYLAYEYAATFAGLDLKHLFQSIAPLLPLMGVVVGFIPGCGPQVLVTTLYVNGMIPFAALLGNTISNDGDALFPAIALNPRAAILATVYSSIPALLLSYLFFFLAPGFMN